MIERRKAILGISNEIIRINAEIECKKKRINELRKLHTYCCDAQNDYIYIDDPAINAMLMEG